jgi:hypothetical protein
MSVINLIVVLNLSYHYYKYEEGFKSQKELLKSIWESLEPFQDDEKLNNIRHKIWENLFENE